MVVGTLGGTVVGAGLTFLIARWQAKREAEQRLVVERRAAYARFNAMADGAYRAIRHQVPSDDPGRAGKVAAFTEALELAYQDLVVLATVLVIDKATEVVDRLMDLAEIRAAPGMMVKSDQWKEGGRLQVAALAYRAVLHEFFVANRADMGHRG
ncbi:MAG TPA: hypothetical protein VMQ65_08675 [Candidatus Limnocylindria bacterium]|nr:hypothetical protein [Candidatus Limnocylindria bacterium]